MGRSLGFVVVLIVVAVGGYMELMQARTLSRNGTQTASQPTEKTLAPKLLRERANGETANRFEASMRSQERRAVPECVKTRVVASSTIFGGTVAELKINAAVNVAAHPNAVVAHDTSRETALIDQLPAIR